MVKGIYYNPQPPRAWSRVQGLCTIASIKQDKYLVYVPRTKQTVPPAVADYENQMLFKGNILQYKKNSSNLTKKQRYVQICKGMWTNRNKGYATQSQTYSNPNTSSLLRVNFAEIPPNTIVGFPNNESGPYQYNVANPFDCSSNSVQTGGTLICNTLANPCTNELIKKTRVINCYSITASDVPGFSNPNIVKDLCWDPRISTWYPRQKLFMNNSNNKWPENYKAFVSAAKPAPPVVSLDTNANASVTLSWTVKINSCIPISSFNVYQNGVFLQSVSYTILTVTIDNLIVGSSNSFYVTSLSYITESSPSNTITLIVA